MSKLAVTIASTSGERWVLTPVGRDGWANLVDWVEECGLPTDLVVWCLLQIMVTTRPPALGQTRSIYAQGWTVTVKKIEE